MACWLLNIGNSRTALCQRRREFFSGIEHHPTAQVADSWHLPQGDHAIASCVVPSVRQTLSDYYGSRIHFIGVSDYPSVDFSRYDCRTLGGDRIANAAAAHHLMPDTPVMAIDCGTAINSVVVDAGGVFCGGVIMPGRRPARSVLSTATAQLPDIPENDPRRITPVALDTADAIASGVDLGIAGAIEFIIRATRKIDGLENAAVILCGGDAEYLSQLVDPSLQARTLPFPLTLFGVSLAASYAPRHQQCLE